MNGRGEKAQPCVGHNQAAEAGKGFFERIVVLLFDRECVPGISDSD